MIQIEENQVNLNVNISSSAQMTANIEPKHKIDVIIGEAAKMDCTRAINYIKSGEAEIGQAVENGISVFNFRTFL